MTYCSGAVSAAVTSRSHLVPGDANGLADEFPEAHAVSGAGLDLLAVLTQHQAKGHVSQLHRRLALGIRGSLLLTQHVHFRPPEGPWEAGRPPQQRRRPSRSAGPVRRLSRR